MQTVKRILRKTGHDGIAALRGDILLYISPLAIIIGFQLELCIRQQIALGTGVLHDRNIVGVEIDACVTGRIALEIYIFIDVRIIALQLHGILELIVLSGQILGIDRIVENQNQSLAVWYLRPDLNLVSILIPFGVVGILSNVFRVVISFNRVEILEESRCFQRAICLQLTLKDRDTCQCYTVGGGTIFAVQTIRNRHEIIQSQRHAIVQCDAVRIDLYLIGQKAGCFIIVAVFAHNISGDSFLKGITAALLTVPFERSVVDKGGNIAAVPDLCVIRVQRGVIGNKNTFTELFRSIDCKSIAIGLKCDHQFGAAVCLFFSRNSIVTARNCVTVQFDPDAALIQIQAGRDEVLNDPFFVFFGIPYKPLIRGIVYSDRPRNLLSGFQGDGVFCFVPVAGIACRLPEVFTLLGRVCEIIHTRNNIALIQLSVVRDLTVCARCHPRQIGCGLIFDGCRPLNVLVFEINREQADFSSVFGARILIVDGHLVGYVKIGCIKNVYAVSNDLLQADALGSVGIPAGAAPIVIDEGVKVCCIDSCDPIHSCGLGIMTAVFQMLTQQGRRNFHVERVGTIDAGTIDLTGVLDDRLGFRCVFRCFGTIGDLVRMETFIQRVSKQLAAAVIDGVVQCDIGGFSILRDGDLIVNGIIRKRISKLGIVRQIAQRGIILIDIDLHGPDDLAVLKLAGLVDQFCGERGLFRFTGVLKSDSVFDLLVVDVVNIAEVSSLYLIGDRIGSCSEGLALLSQCDGFCAGVSPIRPGNGCVGRTVRTRNIRRTSILEVGIGRTTQGIGQGQRSSHVIL